MSEITYVEYLQTMLKTFFNSTKKVADDQPLLEGTYLIVCVVYQSGPMYQRQYRELLSSVLATTFTLSALEPQIHQLSASLRPCMSLDPHLHQLLP